MRTDRVMISSPGPVQGSRQTQTYLSKVDKAGGKCCGGVDDVLDEPPRALEVFGHCPYPLWTLSPQQTMEHETDVEFMIEGGLGIGLCVI